MVSTARSIEITKVRQFKSRVLMYSYATRGLGFLVHCATISRQLGQRSGGSPLFMINHRSSIYIYTYTAEVSCIASVVGLAQARPNYYY